MSNGLSGTASAELRMIDIESQKAELRQWARHRRQSIPDSDALALSIASFAPLLAAEPSMVAGYWPKGSEADVRHLMTALEAMGHRLALPVMQGAERPLIFRRWAVGDALAPGPFQVQQPLDHSPRVVPDVVLVPLLAFDARGWRLGYGGGFYDRTLDELRANPQVRSVGVAFNAQQVAEVPRDDFDRPLDGILTETGLVWVERA